MKELLQSKYARFFLAGLALNMICAWFSKGFYQADEHFQILEFCNFKMGNLTAGQLPWEFQQKIRPSLLPYIAYTLAKLMQLCHIYNPFTLAFLLRLFTGIASWVIVCKFCILLLLKFKTPQGEKIFVLMSLLLWFIPFLSIRFTAENVSGITFLYGLYLILRNYEKLSNNITVYLFAGLLFGFSFFIRLQIVFALVGLMAWLIWVKKIQWNHLALLAIAAIAAIGINVLLDYWFYGTPVFTPFNYYYANVIQHKAADFGVNPWWWFFHDFIIKAAPPVSVVLLIMFFAGIYKNYKSDPFIWVIIPFIFLHCLTAHKELRFLFPMLFPFIYCTALGLDYFLTKNYYQKIHKYVYRASLLLCIPLLAYQTLVPAQVPVCYCQYLYDNVPAKGTTLMVLSNDYDMTIYGLCAGIYKRPELNIVKVDSASQLTEYMQQHQLNTALFMCKENITFAANKYGYKTEMVYCFFPDWILKFNINHWEERSSLWKFYQFSAI